MMVDESLIHLGGGFGSFSRECADSQASFVASVKLSATILSGSRSNLEQESILHATVCVLVDPPLAHPISCSAGQSHMPFYSFIRGDAIVSLSLRMSFGGVGQCGDHPILSRSREEEEP
jgi:hypothetical protein